jgi:hypothetical protein
MDKGRRTDNTMDNRRRIRQYNGQKKKDQTKQWTKEEGQTIQWTKEEGQTKQRTKEKGADNTKKKRGKNNAMNNMYCLSLFCPLYCLILLLLSIILTGPSSVVHCIVCPSFVLCIV